MSDRTNVRPDGQPWTIKEQIIVELCAGLTLQFEVVNDSTAPYRLKLYGESLPFGNREILFDAAGVVAGGGTLTSGLCKPAWLTKLE